jgi:hypothetical protein
MQNLLLSKRLSPKPTPNKGEKMGTKKFKSVLLLAILVSTGSVYAETRAECESNEYNYYYGTIWNWWCGSYCQCDLRPPEDRSVCHTIDNARHAIQLAFCVTLE